VPEKRRAKQLQTLLQILTSGSDCRINSSVDCCEQVLGAIQAIVGSLRCVGRVLVGAAAERAANAAAREEGG
jgi:hypothetical protein